MEKENKKIRDDARKEYNDTVRNLAKFIRKRDPRYKAHLAQQAASVGASKKDTHTQPRPSASTSLPYIEQEWQKTASPALGDDLDWAAAEGEDDEEWECVACGKSFRTEAAWDSHERSKKHLKAVEELRLLMLDDQEELGLVEESDPGMDMATDITASEDLERPQDTSEAHPVIDDVVIILDPPVTVLESEEIEIQHPGKQTTKVKPVRHREILTKSERLARDLAERMVLDADAERTKAPDIASDTHSGIGDSSEGNAPELSKRDKRRMKEAAKKANFLNSVESFVSPSLRSHQSSS